MYTDPFGNCEGMGGYIVELGGYRYIGEGMEGYIGELGGIHC